MRPIDADEIIKYRTDKSGNTRNSLAFVEFMACIDEIPTLQHLSPLARNELVKTILDCGVDYRTAELIVRDFDRKIKRLYSSTNPARNVRTPKLPTTTT